MKFNFDKNWVDSGLFLSPLLPDTAYVVQQMNETCLEMATAEHGARILDIGCGLGRDIFALYEKGQRVLGLDASEKMLAKACQWLDQRNVRLPLIEGIGEQLPCKSSSFKVVLCKGSIDHFSDPVAALLEMKRVIQPDGWIVLGIANFESLSAQLSRWIYKFRSWLNPSSLSSDKEGRRFWDIPPDHQHKFDFFLLRRIIKEHFPGVKAVRGISLLWGLPGWGRFLECLPTGIAQGILKVLGHLANLGVFWSDILIVSLTKK